MKIGISLVLSPILAQAFGLVYREVRDGTGPSVLSYSAYWCSDNENPALETFLKLLFRALPLTLACQLDVSGEASQKARSVRHEPRPRSHIVAGYIWLWRRSQLSRN